MSQLIAIDRLSNIPPKYRNTPIEHLLGYQNLNRPCRKYSKAELLIGMCMDNRKLLHIPDNFAFVLRTGGANLRYSEFKVAYAIAVGDVKCIALIGHNHCNMSNLKARQNLFVNGLVKNAGWKKEQARKYFEDHAATFEIGNEIDFILSEVKRLRLRYPKIRVAPMFYKIEDNRLYFLKEK
jgi:carbonic anhydrase